MHILKCCQEPLNICTAQFDLLKRIDTLLNISYDATPFVQKCLPLRVNFWFRAPGLTLHFPIGFPCLCINSGGTLYSRSLLAILLIGSACFAAPALFGRGLCAILVTHRLPTFSRTAQPLQKNYIL